MPKVLIACLLTLGILPLGAVAAARSSPHDPNLPTVKPAELRQLSADRIRQRIIEQSQARYADRCVCPYMTKDSNGQSCKGRHVAIKTKPPPVCYPGQVTSDMIIEWRRRQP